MRVLFVTNRYPTRDRPGSSPCIEAQRRALMTLGHEVDLLFCDGESSRLNYFRTMARVLRLAIRGRWYDVVHAHYGHSGAISLPMRVRAPVVVTFRGSDVLSRRERPIGRCVARLASAAIVMTAEMRTLLGRRDAHVIPYGIDLQRFVPEPREYARRRLGLPQDVPLVLFPYSPDRPEKRFDIAERATALLRERLPSIQLLTVYDKPHDLLPSYMNATDAMVLVSDSEGAPVAVREAMACGLPIVTVRVGDVEDVIADTEGCHLADPDPNDIAAKLARVLASGRRTNGRAAVSRLSDVHAAAQVEDVYKTLVHS